MFLCRYVCVCVCICMCVFVCMRDCGQNYWGVGVVGGDFDWCW